jgi:hypothetical protein
MRRKVHCCTAKSEKISIILRMCRFCTFYDALQLRSWLQTPRWQQLASRDFLDARSAAPRRRTSKDSRRFHYSRDLTAQCQWMSVMAWTQKLDLSVSMWFLFKDLCAAGCALSQGGCVAY